MAVLSMDSLPLGFRFRPTDEELITHYLKHKINGRHSDVQVIPEIDVCKWEPWDLPGLSVIKADDPEWFFFCPKDRKYPNGQRSNRATEAGYWKATGKDRTIRTRKGSGITSIIGMKKTLVFYKGRAPKGERTNWIMHEYRPTIKELDGTGPGQTAFVLCRLFRKPEEKLENQNYDQVEQSGYSPTVTKSSTDDTSSDLVQETASPDMPLGNDSEGTQTWLTYKTDNTTQNNVVLGDSCSNSLETSDIEDHGVEAAATEACQELGKNSHLYHPVSGQIEGKLLYPEQSNAQSDLSYYVDSPYANDFGGDLIGLNFQDATEHEASLSDLLGEILNNNDEFSGEESTTQKNFSLLSENQPFGHLQQGSLDCMLNGTNTENYMAQPQLYDSQMRISQTSFAFGQAQASNFKDLGETNFNGFGSHPLGQDTLSANAAVGTSFDLFNNIEESANLMNNVNNGSNVNGTGIKIRSRNTRPSFVQQDSYNFSAQGTAPRRIRLQVDITDRSGAVDDSMVQISSYHEDEVHSGVKEPDKVEEQTASSDEIQNDSQLSDSDSSGELTDESSSNDDIIATSDEVQKDALLPDTDKSKICSEKHSPANLRLRMKQNGEPEKEHRGSPESGHAQFSHCKGGASSIYIVGVTAVLVASVVFAGIYRCLTSYAFYD